MTTIAPRTPTPTGPLHTLRRWQPSSGQATGAIVLTSVAYGFASFFARRLTDAGLDPTTVAFARFALIAAVLARHVHFGGATRVATHWGLVSGAAMAGGWIAYVHAVETGEVGAAGVVYMTYPLFTLVALALVFGRRPTTAQVTGGVLVVIGATLALGIGDGSVPLVAFAAPATFGFAVAVLTERLAVLDPVERLGTVAVGASAALVPLVATLPRAAVIPPDATAWAWIVGLGVGSALVPMLIYAAAAPVLGAARTAVAGASELPTVIVIGAVFFGETLRVGHLLGAAVIVLAIVWTPASRAPHGRPDDA